ncbi:21407_t:CDS:2, partial [Gigaspora margarita]
FLEFCKGRVALEVNDRKVLHKKYLEGLDAKIKETTKNKKFTKNELKSIRDKLLVSNNDIKNQNYERTSIMNQETTKLVSFQRLSGYDDIFDWIRQWINPFDNMLESDLVLNYIFIPLEIGLNKFLFGKFHLHGPEHPTQCSYERKKIYHRPPFTEWPKNLKEAVNLFEKPEDEHFDANDSVLETVVIIQNNGDEPIYIPNDKHKLLSFDTANEQGFTLFRVYSRKVDTAITYSPETGIKLYLLICEAKRLNKHQGGDYNKLCRMLNDAANSFILYWTKKCKKVTKELKKLFCEFRWIGLFSSDGKLNLMIYQICEETKINFITYLNSHPVSIPISNMNHDMASALEIFLQIEDIFQMNLKVIEKIQKIVDQINIEESENFETPLEYLKKLDNAIDKALKIIDKIQSLCIYMKTLDKHAVFKFLKYNSEKEYYKKFRIEIANLKEIFENDNVIRFYGITKEPSKKFHSMLQYCFGKNLREYLNYKKVSEGGWPHKIVMATEIATGLKFIH